jgi:thiopeptide-type bacteriocin biosynthesis protein
MTMESNTKQDQKQVNPLKRTYMIGDEWLYYKFYCGPKTADVLLTDMIKPITEEMIANNIIDYWFFIRYGDPKNHIRVRFHISNPNNFTPVLMAVREHTNRFIQQGLVWKVMVDTYEREVERYGPNSMDLAEKIFYLDSRMISDMLSMIEGDEGEHIRWLFGVRAVDTLLDDFGVTDMEKKFEIVTSLRENFGREFGMGKGLKDQLEKKFRSNRKEINIIMDRSNDQESELLPLFQLLDQKSNDVKPFTGEILKLDNEKRLMMALNELIPSYSHMMINRLFKSKQRLHELVMYDFLHRYYKSEIGRRKYSHLNKKNKKNKDKDKKKQN